MCYSSLEVQIGSFKDYFNLLTGTYQPEGSSIENEELMQSTEVQKFLNLLREQNYFGTPLPDIVPPRKEEASLSISLALKNKYKNTADINLDIQNILDNFYDTRLNVSFNIYELERKIEELSYVKYDRVSYKIYDRDPNEYYQLGYMMYDEKSENYYCFIVGEYSFHQPKSYFPSGIKANLLGRRRAEKDVRA